MDTLDYISDSVKQATSWPDWQTMQTKEFTVVFRLPYSLPMLKADQEFSVKRHAGFWYTKVPFFNSKIVKIYILEVQGLHIWSLKLSVNCS